MLMYVLLRVLSAGEKEKKDQETLWIAGWSFSFGYIHQPFTPSDEAVCHLC